MRHASEGERYLQGLGAIANACWRVALVLSNDVSMEEGAGQDWLVGGAASSWARQRLESGIETETGVWRLAVTSPKPTDGCWVE